MEMKTRFVACVSSLGRPPVVSRELRRFLRDPCLQFTHQLGATATLLPVRAFPKTGRQSLPSVAVLEGRLRSSADIDDKAGVDHEYWWTKKPSSVRRDFKLPRVMLRGEYTILERLGSPRVHEACLTYPVSPLNSCKSVDGKSSVGLVTELPQPTQVERA
jgi:hypothetical protein